MKEAKRLLVQSWFIKAQHDLATARKAASDPDPYYDTAIFHCQQAAEKAVKGYLVYCDQPFEKSHDIREMVNLALPFEARFSSWMTVAEELTQYAYKFRYPTIMISAPEKEEYEQAFAKATDLYNFALSLLPLQVHPPTR